MNKRFLQISLFLILLCTFGECALKHRYHTNNEMLSIMAELSSKYPEISRIYSIGKSVQGTELRVIEISDNPGFHDPLEPEVKYVGNIHGNEVVGRQILLHLVEYLLSSYGKNDTITRLINNTRIHILVCMNPDGYARGRDQYGRYNYNGVDLNRNFKDPFDNRYEQIQQETLAITQWLKDYPFMLSAGLHGGSLVVNYPYDNLPRSERSRYVYKYSPSPDDDVFIDISKSYSLVHPTMTVEPQCNDSKFKDGITNGAKWYTISGGMQDYNYRYSNCFEVTIELSCVKFPPENQLEMFWLQNKDSLIYFLQKAHMGIKGYVKDIHGNGIPKASFRVKGKEKKDIYTWATGEYWRLLLPGIYDVTATALGYITSSATVTIHDGEVTIYNFYLEPIERFPSETTNCLDIECEGAYTGEDWL